MTREQQLEDGEKTIEEEREGESERERLCHIG